MPHYQSLKPTIRLTFLNLLTGTRFSQCNIITVEDQIIRLSDVIVLSFWDLVLNCSLEFLNRIFTVTFFNSSGVLFITIDSDVSF